MKITLYNTFSKKKEQFKPLREGEVSLYDCGPTVYFYAHIGNLWRYCVSDFLRRILEYNQLKVNQVMNITDVGHLTEDDLLAGDTGDDKLEVAARKEKKTPQAIAKHYTTAYFKDRRKLNILDPKIICKATEYISQMISLIKKLEKKGFAYQLDDRVCFDVSKFKNYGKLSGKNLKELKIGSRLEPIAGKKNPYDFSLWIKDENHLLKWDSPWGVGYPGWHIECSAMSIAHLGSQIDIHTGGEDNIFPHHENEIAQSEAALGGRFVNYWIHVRHNLVNGKKMSKSAGTAYLLDDLVKQGFDPISYRYLCLTTHYRSNLNFTFKSLADSQRALNKLRLLVLDWKKATDRRTERNEKKYKDKFCETINNDIGTPQALALVWKVVGAKDLSKQSRLELVLSFDFVLGLGLDDYSFKVPQKIQNLAEQREDYRKKKKYKEADKIRGYIEKMGFSVEDSKKGAKIRPLSVDFD
jgi:cysteinyl-tRNA synthetase